MWSITLYRIVIDHCRCVINIYMSYKHKIFLQSLTLLPRKQVLHHFIKLQMYINQTFILAHNKIKVLNSPNNKRNKQAKQYKGKGCNYSTLRVPCPIAWTSLDCQILWRVRILIVLFEISYPTAWTLLDDQISLWCTG